MKLKNFLIGFGLLAVLLTVVPFFAADYWWIRMFDYPHIQLTILTFTAFICYFVRFDLKNYKDYFFAFVIGACLLFQFYKIYPYTPIAENEIKSVESFESSKNLKVYISNVLQKNNKKHLLLEDIEKFKPDIVVLLETNNDWIKATKTLAKDYKYSVKKPLPNTYGMLMYSNKELINPKVNFLVADSIPSIEAKLKLNDKDTIQLYVIHPTPPMPQHNPKSTDRDGEMMITAKMARDSKLPTIVMGDFNDVAWSQTSKKFEKLSELLDPRIGRGFYTTYNANSFLLRWPLDHVYLSKEFLVNDMDKGENINSDHFPMFASVVLQRNNTNEEVEPISEEQLKEINKTIRKSKKRGN